MHIRFIICVIRRSFIQLTMISFSPLSYLSPSPELLPITSIMKTAETWSSVQDRPERGGRVSLNPCHHTNTGRSPGIFPFSKINRLTSKIRKEIGKSLSKHTHTHTSPFLSTQIYEGISRGQSWKTFTHLALNFRIKYQLLEIILWLH